MNPIEKVLQRVKSSIRIVPMNDSKVCIKCRRAARVGHPLPPDHPNCRCQTINKNR